MATTIKKIHDESDGTITPQNVAQLFQDACPYMSDSEAMLRAKIAIITLRPTPKSTETLDIIILVVCAILFPLCFFIIVSIFF